MPVFSHFINRSDEVPDRRINPVERMYAAFPAYLYLNASLGGGLLAPLLEVQDTLVGQEYAAQDLGTPTSSAIFEYHDRPCCRHKLSERNWYSWSS